MVESEAPQVADRTEPFRSRIREQLGQRTQALEELAVERYARGLSTRDIESVFRDEAGQSMLSRTAVSEVTERLWAEYESFATRGLAAFEVVYLFVDGIAERLRTGQPREAVLCAWGICADGAKVRARRRTPRAVGPSSRTSSEEGFPIRCSSPRTALRD